MIARFLKYLVTGGGATLVDVGVFTLLTKVGGFWYVGAFTLSCLAGMVTNFLLSRQFVFGVRWESTFKQFFVFACVALPGIIFNLGSMQLLVNHLGADPVLARVFSAGIVVGVSFLGHSLFSFRKPA